MQKILNDFLLNSQFLNNQSLVNMVILTTLVFLLLLILILYFKGSGADKIEDTMEDFFHDDLANRQVLKQDIQSYLQEMENDESQRLQNLKQDMNTMLINFSGSVKDNMGLFRGVEEQNIRQLTDLLKKDMKDLRDAVDLGLEKVRQDNERKLEEIRGTVNEQLQSTLEKRITQSFKTVSDQLQQVYQGLGEMKNLANDVGGLKKVLSNVKTRGILGEVQLGAILQEILAREQYEENIATVPNSSNRVEFAIKMPGDGSGVVYLPVDAKFPNDRYQQLLNAKDTGDKILIEAAYKDLENVVKSEARDIKTKYVEPPYTTDFGIMFLASEGLYAEVVSRGLMQQLQREYKITVTGPSTMAAFLNSLQMGFRTLAIQKRSNEVWTVLSAVKTEFGKFGDGLQKMQDKMDLARKEFDQLVGVRTRAINRKLANVTELDIHKAQEILEIEE